MREWIEQHLAQRQAQGQKKETLAACHYCLKAFESYCFELEMSAELLAGYHQHLLWTPCPATGRLPAPATVDQHLRMVRTFLRWATRQSYLNQDPTSGLVLPRPRSRPEELLSREILDSVLAGPDLSQPQGLRDRALFGLICELGFSSLRCRNLDLADLDRSHSRLRGLRLSPYLAELLYRYTDRARPALLTEPGEPALFLSKFGRRMHEESVTARVYHYSRRQASPRSLRRAWLTYREAALNRRLPGV